MSLETKPTKKTETRPANRSKTAVSSLTLGNADDALTLAKELQKFVKENKLTSNIQGKEFPNVEAWQFAGSLLGLSPMLESIEDKSTEAEIKWNATVKVVSIKSGNEVGRGFATCSNKESTKKFFADYAICSMAQTRAVGKAYRLALGWLMKAAGYEATPAEEMSDVGTGAEVVPAAPLPASVYTAEEAIKALLAIGTRAELQQLWPQLEAHRGDEIFDLASAATKIRWNAPDYKSLDQMESDVASRAQRDLAHKFLASGKNDGYRLEALHLLADAGMSHAQASTLIEKAKANVEQPAMKVASADATPAPVQYATAAQKEEIIRLLNVPVITRPEKTKMLLAINRLDEERAVQAIAKLRKTIDARQNAA